VERSTEAGEAIAIAPRRPVILVADADPDVLDLVGFRFERAGFRVLQAADGLRALAVAREHRPDCAVLDVLLPGLDGLEVLRRLRADPATTGLPVVLLSALTREADVVQGLEQGADDYVRKPFGVLELLARVNRLVGRRELGLADPERAWSPAAARRAARGGWATGLGTSWTAR